jgi:copper homeostasis protein CutC
VVISIHDVVVLVVLLEDGIKVAVNQSVVSVVVGVDNDAKAELLMAKAFNLIGLVKSFLLVLHRLFESISDVLRRLARCTLNVELS